MIIAFSGNDGSGKTTHAKLIFNKLKLNNNKITYREEFNYKFIKFLLFPFSNSFINNKRDLFLNSNKKYSVFFYGWIILVYLNCIIEYIIFKTMYKNRIVILDRYIYDYYLSFNYLGYTNKFIYFLFNKFPNPDKGIMLFSSPEVNLKRRLNNHNIDYYKEQNNKYKIFFRNKNFIQINTSKSNIESINNLIFKYINL